MVALGPSLAAEKGDSAGRPDFVAPRDFSWKSLIEPENLFWPAYFWYWNGPPTPDVLRQQLADMAGHEARSVCVVPMPHEFRPVTMNTSMDVDFPKFASSAAHQNGTALALTESFGVYGNGLTPAQMKWLVDYQSVLGFLRTPLPPQALVEPAMEDVQPEVLRQPRTCLAVEPVMPFSG